MNSKNNIYFISDFHLGVPNSDASLKREKDIVRWLDFIKKDALEVYILGDVFDFWFEYKHVVPKGFVRLLGKLAELSDSGIKIHYFTGNHDMWVFDYLPKEIGCTLYREPIEREFGNKKFFIGHGDGLGPGDHGYKFIKKVFASKICQWLFARLHPNLGIGIANYWSRRSRIATSTDNETYKGDDKEFLVLFCKEKIKTQAIDYFIFGHRHLPIDMRIGESRYINLGEWINYRNYAVFNGSELLFKTFD
ncbi:MAG TPA: UDP-2,3-diacylglucosamine diphosphatase [Bacteroidia bacterium]|nr:UDP-2,3-diacylglucosamine diphosphatase [Bacteroidia bacterium]HNT79144.1 UDP-2,3-diacylglucosamine diphosphatase [Bacteroidia bacterium]